MTSRPWRLTALFYGLPAAAGVAIVGWAVCLCLTTSRERVIERYRARAQSSYDAGNYREALVCFERLAAAPAPQEADLLGLVLAAEKLGMFERAATLLSRLAPEDRGGFAPAHMLLARRLVEGGGRDPMVLKAAGRHLERALEARPDAIEAKRLLAEVRERSGDLAGAADALAGIAERYPAARLQRARVLVRLERNAEARMEAESALEDCRRALEVKPNDRGALLAYAEAACFLERFAEAETALRGFPKSDDFPEVRHLLAKTLATHALAAAQKGALDEQAGLLDEALRADPENLIAVNQVVAMLEGDAKIQARARRLLAALPEDASRSGPVRYAKGVAAWLSGDRTEARRQWEASLASAPKANESAAHLAWLLATDAPPDMSRAAQLVDKLLAENPSSAQGTRARDLIRLRRGELAEALPRLEHWIAEHPGDAEAKREAARAYETLGVKSKK